ncbi:nucleoside hydrolase [Halostella sp. JP-L12]|uniref:nucleoside hydrolase n=1 Tax=Halostella TaxID=1843185 RepID=UPI000EF77CDE|nr:MULTISPECIES: nucleoside hydrolase [Halostella]NHN48156.1 nucleoside hydrolase [Halostella sp. JP-L12]
MAKKVLLDVDPGTDDALLLAMLLAHDDWEVVGVTTVAGNTTVENTTRNALSVLEFLDRSDVPVARGADGPLTGELERAEWVHGPDGIRGDLPEPTAEPVEMDASQFMLDRAREYGDDLTVAAVGPLTNVAVTTVRDPAFAETIGDLYFMGGAALTSGNATPAAEFNAYADPEAAYRVVRDTDPHMVGLGVTEPAVLPTELVERWCAADDPLSTVGEWCNYPDQLRHDGGYSVPDAVVGADLIADVLEYERLPLAVDTSEGPSRGATIADTRAEADEKGTPNASVATDVDVETFREVVVDLVESL